MRRRLALAMKCDGQLLDIQECSYLFNRNVRIRGFLEAHSFFFFLSFFHVFPPPAGVSWSYTEKHTEIWSLKGLGVGYKALRVVVCIVDIITTCLIQHSRRIFIYLYCMCAT